MCEGVTDRVLTCDVRLHLHVIQLYLLKLVLIVRLYSMCRDGYGTVVGVHWFILVDKPQLECGVVYPMLQLHFVCSTN